MLYKVFIHKNFNYYFKRGNICINPNIQKKDPKKIFVVDLVKAKFPKSISFRLCLIPNNISKNPMIRINKPISHGKIISMFKLFCIIS